ncbi:hypothetical protein PR048_010667 [Dryococelus australis]|uniref:DUF4371 domain-containing protein n=1 Tax=Dryococelus australis TaxID=614101 RepID=A0ABQ9I3C7_9NEOP|nr:hypothetical protein PR048_010667 [Dryococelus australis]
MYLCVRYVDIDEKVLREDFLQFVPVYDVTGKGLATSIFDNLTELGLDTENLRGQRYYGASSMPGKCTGAQSISKAVYVHCSAHSLNLAITKIREIQAIRNSIVILSRAHNFFNTPKSKGVLSKCIE